MHHAKDQRVTAILQTQIATMKNHVQVMNQLLNPSQNNQTISLPPIPQNMPVNM
jgi:hypothetical protein